MEEVIMQQIESLENIIDSQQRQLNILRKHLNYLAKIEAINLTFGSITEELRNDKNLILCQYI